MGDHAAAEQAGRLLLPRRSRLTFGGIIPDMNHRQWPDRGEVLARSTRIIQATEVLERVKAKDRDELGAMLCLARSRRLLAATARLIEGDLADTCGGLVRQLFESITAGTCWWHGRIGSDEYKAHYRWIGDRTGLAKARKLIERLFGLGDARRIAFDDLRKRCVKLLEELERPCDAQAFERANKILYEHKSHFSVHSFGSMNKHLRNGLEVQLIPQEPGDAVDLLNMANELVTFLALEISTLDLSPEDLGVRRAIP